MLSGGKNSTLYLVVNDSAAISHQPEIELVDISQFRKHVTCYESPKGNRSFTRRFPCFDVRSKVYYGSSLRSFRIWRVKSLTLVTIFVISMRSRVWVRGAGVWGFCGKGGHNDSGRTSSLVFFDLVGTYSGEWGFSEGVALVSAALEAGRGSGERRRRMPRGCACLG
jgi:hypothetical protein